MTADEHAKIVEYSANPGVNDDDVQKEIQTIWEALRNDPDLRRLAEEIGISPEAIKKQQFAPFTATRPEAQFGVAETILISVVGGILTHIAKNALDSLWERYVKPRLEKRFGADLEPKQDAAS